MAVAPVRSEREGIVSRRCPLSPHDARSEKTEDEDLTKQEAPGAIALHLGPTICGGKRTAHERFKSRVAKSLGPSGTELKLLRLLGRGLARAHSAQGYTATMTCRSVHHVSLYFRKEIQTSRATISCIQQLHTTLQEGLNLGCVTGGVRVAGSLARKSFLETGTPLKGLSVL